MDQIQKKGMYKVETNKFVAKAVKETLGAIITAAFPAVKADVLLQHGPKGQCEYVSPSAMKEFNVHKNKKEGTTYGCKTVAQFAKRIAESFQQNSIIGSLQANEKGFLQIKVKDSFVEERINSIVHDLDYPLEKKEKVLVDFSSPNIAKEMHVGHLRSTIIGESICRLLEYEGCEVVRVNHLGDWGTQFGMLIAYMREAYPDYQNNFPDIRDLDLYYRAARQRFDSDPVFKKISQETVVKLQSYDPTCIKAWKLICAVSRDYFNQIYGRLGVKIQEFGESFYNPFIPPMVEELTKLNLIQEDATKTKKFDKAKNKKVESAQKEKEEPPQKEKAIEEKQDKDSDKQASDDEVIVQGKKAKCLFIEKFPIPLIVVKSDGGFNYDSTDLAAIQYRLFTEKADRIIYITDLGQKDHFDLIFAGARKIGWLTTQRVEHMGFGCVLGEDGKKFKTRNGKTVKLLDLLNEGKQKALTQLKSREKTQKQPEEGEQIKEQVFTALKPEEYEDAAERLGIASIKYFDLKQNRTSDYIFSFEKMLDPKGNTAVYLIYAYVRICSIIRKSGLTSAEITEMAKQKPFKITHADERVLAAMLIKFYDVVHEATNDLTLNKVTDFIYDISVKVQENYKKYRIVGDQHMESRVILCEAIRKILEKSFFFVGIVPIERI